MSEPMVWHDEGQRLEVWGELDPPDACMCTTCVLGYEPEQVRRIREVFGRATTENVIASMADFTRQMAKVAATINNMTIDPRFRRLLGLPRRDEHHPPKLSIDGAAYHRRRNARRRRR